MSRVLCLPPLLAALAALFYSGTAAGQPVRWSYTSTGGERGNVRLLGRDRVESDSEYGVRQEVLPVTDMRVDGSPPSTFGYYGPINVGVTVTDSASGQSGQIIVPYFGEFDISETNYRMSYSPGPGLSTRLVLGRTEYWFTTTDPRVTRGEVSVTLAEAPEPSTLILAGLGVAGVAVGRRLRGRRQTGGSGSGKGANHIISVTPTHDC